ncbi:uncharacterized protein LOC142229563 [Haematobia irritans]|uniref:uncharacterized protein LOC142229563 n=1 Tax=Haematobia irritans TaxID=7368 RepID=UPI003F508C1A
MDILRHLDWRDNIENKIKAGVCKVVEVSKDLYKSPVWDVFSKITDEKGTLLENAVYCRHCKHVLKCYSPNTTALMRHSCYIKNRREMNIQESDFPVHCPKKLKKPLAVDLEKDRRGKTLTPEFDIELFQKTISKSLKMGIHTLENHKTSTDPVWKKFAFIAMKGNNHVFLKQIVCCRICNTILKYNEANWDNLREHICVDTWKKRSPLSTEKCLKDREMMDIQRKLKSGIYNLMRKQNGKSDIWKLFALIAKDEETIVEDHVYCTACSQILSYRGKCTTSLNRHKCYIDLGYREDQGQDTNSSAPISMTPWPLGEKVSGRKYQSEVKLLPPPKQKTDFGMRILQKSIETKIKEGFYKLNAKEITEDPLWKVFGFISMDNGSTLNGMVCCRQCLTVLRYDGQDDYELKEHGCYTINYGQANQDQGPQVHNELDTEVMAGSSQNYSMATIVKNEIDIEETQAQSQLSQSQMYKNITITPTPHPPLQTSQNIVNLDEFMVTEGNNLVFDTDGNFSNNTYTFHIIQEAEEEEEEEEGNSQAYIKEELEFEDEMPHTENQRITIQSNMGIETIIEGHANGTEYANGTDAIYIKKEINEEEMITEYPYQESFSNEGSKDKGEHVIDINQQKIEENLHKGLYHLKDNPNSSSLWKIFALLETPEGSTIDPWVYCRVCHKILENLNETLSHHICYSETLSYLPEEDKSEALEKISNLIMEDLVPLSMIQGQGFRKVLNFCIQLGAKYKDDNIQINDLIPNSIRISQNLHNMAEERENFIKLKINQRAKETLSITLDFLGSDDARQREWLIPTIRYMDKGKFYNITLGAKLLDSPGINLETELKLLAKKFNIENLETCIIVCKKYRDFKNTSMINWCSSSLFKEILENAFTETSELITMAKSLLRHKENYKVSGFSKNSHYNLFKTLIENWPKIKEIPLEPETTEINMKSLELLIDLCKKFECIFKRLQARRLPSLCFVIPSINRLKILCSPSSQDTLEIIVFKTNILQNIQKIWLKNINIWHKAAYFLYPPANHDQTQDLKEIKEFCMKQLKLLNNDKTKESSPMTSSFGNSDHSENMDSDEINFFFPNLPKATTGQGQSLLSCSFRPEDEVQRYSLENIMIQEHFDVIAWWQTNSGRFPLLSRLAFKLLTLPASTLASERILHLAKNFFNDHENSTTPETFSNILFLNSMKENNL